MLPKEKVISLAWRADASAGPARRRVRRGSVCGVWAVGRWGAPDAASGRDGGVGLGQSHFFSRCSRGQGRGASLSAQPLNFSFQRYAQEVPNSDQGIM